jgi:hypothetical protein
LIIPLISCTNKLPVTVNEPEMIALPVYGNVGVPAPPGAYEALNAFVANEAVPCNEPVIPAVTFNDPVICELPSERYPFFILNSFAMSFHCPRFGLL